jgi:tetratricopeptide (TPR) repeat protein
MSVASSEACIHGTARATGGDVPGNTVSLASILVSPKTKRTYEQAAKALTVKNFDEAEKQLQKAVSISPDSAVGWCLMGTLHEEKLELDKAFSDYSQALSADPRLLPAYLGLARIAFLEKRWQEVVEFTDQMAKIDPIAVPAGYFYNAAAHFNLRNLISAEKSAHKFECLDPEHERPQVYLLLGDILALKRDLAGAAEQKKTFLRIVPDAYDADEIKEQIKILEDHSSGKKSVSTTSTN